jgi:hypothetical protein
LPSVTVTPVVVTDLLPLPAFLSVKAKAPPLIESVPNSVPLVTVVVPAAVTVPS